MNVVTNPSETTGSLSEIASIVHDLRNPLAAIHGSAEMLVRSGLSEPQVNRIARNMYSASVRMRELLEEFLDRSRGTETEMESSDVRELVTNAVDKIAVSAEFQSVHIVQAVPEGLVVAVDRHRIHRVLVNLLVNALEVMPKGGTIHISAVFRPPLRLDPGSRYRAGDRSRNSEPALPTVRHCGQGEWHRPGPCLFTAGCDRSRRRDVGRVVPPGSLFCLSSCPG